MESKLPCCLALITDEFEKERAAMLDSVGRLGTEAAEQHKLEWENRKRADEIRELQKVGISLHLPFAMLPVLPTLCQMT